MKHGTEQCETITARVTKFTQQSHMSSASAGLRILVNHLHYIFQCWKPDSDIMRIWIPLMHSESQGLESSKLDGICPIALVIIMTQWSKYVILRTNCIDILKFQIYLLPTLFSSHNSAFHPKYSHVINNGQFLTPCSLCGKYTPYRTYKYALCLKIHSYRINMFHLPTIPD